MSLTKMNRNKCGWKQLQIQQRRLPMISVGVDVSKEKSTVCALKPYGEIGDVRRFHNAKSLIAYAGIDAPPYQSGKFTGTNRHISKRGSSTLRKVGFETMTCLVMQKKCGDPVYDFIKKKQAEGKACKVAKIAGFNKFLRIYYARVMEVYQ